MVKEPSKFTSIIVSFYGLDYKVFPKVVNVIFPFLAKLILPISTGRDISNLVFHSDQGWQYQNPRFVAFLKKKYYAINVT